MRDGEKNVINMKVRRITKSLKIVLNLRFQQQFLITLFIFSVHPNILCPAMGYPRLSPLETSECESVSKAA